MSNEILFRTQLASIMEVLANAAVEEICKLVDDGYAVVHLQMSEYQKENEALKMRLRLMELNAARECAERAAARENPLDRYPGGVLASREKPRATAEEGPAVAGNRVLGNPGDVCLQSLHQAVDEDNPATAFHSTQAEPAGAENDRSKSILIKEEVPEEHSDAHTDLKIPVQGALDSGVGAEDGVTALEFGVSSAECSEELAVPPRAGLGSALWEVSGLEAVLRLQAEHGANQRPGDVGLDCAIAGRLGGSQSASAHDVPGPTRAPEPSRPGCPAPPELRAAPEGPLRARVRPSSPPRSDVKADVVVIGSVKEESETLRSEWDKAPPMPPAANAQHGRHRDDRENEDAQPGPVIPSSLPCVWPTGGQITATASMSDTAGLNGLMARGRNFGASGDFAASCNGSGREKRFVCRYCGKGFTRQNALEIHQRVHTGEKPFRCAQCGKRFSDSSNHRRHQSVHSRERPFSCTQCERSFSHHYQLKVHQRLHSGVQPFSCVHCGKKFGERSFLKAHQQRDHAPLYA